MARGDYAGEHDQEKLIAVSNPIIASTSPLKGGWVGWGSLVK